jgi:hypothetical protein
MTTDTPDTDAQLTPFESISKLGKRFINRRGVVSAEFARDLERQRNEWRQIANGLFWYAAAYIRDYTPNISKEKGNDILNKLVALNSSLVTRHSSLSHE